MKVAASQTYDYDYSRSYDSKPTGEFDEIL